MISFMFQGNLGVKLEVATSSPIGSSYTQRRLLCVG
jgi:hypothetical protein